MKVLITGGAGFLGSHLANALHQAGNSVRVVDDLSSGDPTHLEPGINFTRGDVRDIPKLWTILPGVEVVYHLAARVSVPASVLYPHEYNDANVGGTVSLLEACRDVGVRRVVLASSATVYGNQPQQPVNETMLPRPAAPYAVSKVAAEQYLFNLGQLSGFETVALRIFNAYGPRQPLPPVHAPVIPQFVQQILGHGSVIVFGDGSQTRDFVYVDDVVTALTRAGVAPDVDRQIINIGSGEETSLDTLINLIAQAVGEKASVLYNRESSGGIRRLVADLSKAKQLLDYEPSTYLADGLRKLVEQEPRIRRALDKPSAGAAHH
jgi:UDP-glucose 4-epimerase